jgi:NADP-dependent 3-hydroxy acid dehydrogenase YdfG
MTTTLITGANKGLGRETARRLLQLGHTVYLGCRDLERGKRAAAELGGVPVTIDVTSDASVTAAAARISERAGRLDVLINNAAVPGGFLPAADTTAADMLAVYDTNVFGVVRVLHAFLPLLERSRAPVVVNVSSGMGSLGVTTDPARLESTLKGLAYPSSKSALNMLTSQYAKSCPRLRINARRSRLHRHRPQRAPPYAERRGRGGGHRPDGQHRPGRPQRNVHRRQRNGRLVSRRRRGGRADSIPARLDCRRRDVAGRRGLRCAAPRPALRPLPRARSRHRLRRRLPGEYAVRCGKSSIGPSIHRGRQAGPAAGAGLALATHAFNGAARPGPACSACQ